MTRESSERTIGGKLKFNSESGVFASRQNSKNLTDFKQLNLRNCFRLLSMAQLDEFAWHSSLAYEQEGSKGILALKVLRKKVKPCFKYPAWHLLYIWISLYVRRSLHRSLDWARPYSIHHFGNLRVDKT